MITCVQHRASLNEDREKLLRLGACVQIIPFPVWQLRKFTSIVRMALSAALCAALYEALCTALV